MRNLISSFVITSFSLYSLYAQKLEMADKVYDANIKTVQLYPFDNSSYPEHQPSVISFQQTRPLMLMFDELYYDFTDYYLKIYHCQANWEKSMLADMEFLMEFNEQPIRDYEYSQNTTVPYTHYQVALPRVKLPGNYVVAVYRKEDGDKLILSKRFIVYDNKVVIKTPEGVASAMSNKFSNQQVEFLVGYRDLESFNPLEDFKIYLRQNQRWDNMISEIKPSMVRDAQRQLEFRHINNENAFKAGNEFRFFDLRMFRSRGQNVAEIQRSPDLNKAILATDISRDGLAYSIYNDQNGLYFIESLEPGATKIETDYMEVHFSLQSEPLKDKVYVMGAFNGWDKNKENTMVYNKKNGTYNASFMLRQGFYDYLYWVDGETPYHFEGSHFQTRNQYEIFVYYRSPGTLFDIPVGYFSYFTGMY